MKGFTVIDNKTGNYPDCEEIALNEDWAKHLCYCDIDNFAITEDGSLILLDECGKCAYCPEGRFTIVTDNNVGDKQIEELEADNERLRNMWAKAVSDASKAESKTPKWIPVTERLPDLELEEVKTDDKDVFPCLAVRKHPRAKNGKYTAKVWYDGYGFIDGISNDVTDEVTHWQPLPEPPKGE